RRGRLAGQRPADRAPRAAAADDRRARPGRGGHGAARHRGTQHPARADRGRLAADRPDLAGHAGHGRGGGGRRGPGTRGRGQRHPERRPAVRRRARRGGARFPPGARARPAHPAPGGHGRLPGRHRPGLDHHPGHPGTPRRPLSQRLPCRGRERGARVARAPLQQTDPARVGRYRLVARLGAGGMGVVYLAEPRGAQPVAVKVLRPELADNPEFRTRFGREVTALTRIQGMCTVRVIEADTEAPKPFLVTEYADGPSLSEYVDARGPLDPQLLYGLATGLAEALTAIHAAGIVHRDLKPSNVLLTPGGPKVIDFGIAQALDTTSLTRTGITVGSAGFMAPEQIMGRAGTAADVFTWAVTVAFAAGGRTPFGTGASDAIMYRIVHEAPALPAVPPGLRPLVEAALAKDPQARPTAPQLLAELTNSQLTRAGARYENPTQTVLAQTWHPSATGPMVAAPGPTAPGPTGARPARRRTALLPVVLTLAFLLAA